MADSLDFLLARRSAGALEAPGPTRAQIDQMLKAAATVPDHGRLRPYRFVVVEGDGRAAFGDALAACAAERRPDTPAEKLAGMRAKAFRSPTVIAIIASPKPGKIEVWEQHATAACAGYAITLAAHALGVGAVWKSVPFTKGRALTDLLGLTASEEMLGFIHLGTPAIPEIADRPSLDLATVTTILDGAAPRSYR
ncbi:MAG TPA: nitroreductase [Kofleriaceae bacterium]